MSVLFQGTDPLAELVGDDRLAAYVLDWESGFSITKPGENAAALQHTLGDGVWKITRTVNALANRITEWAFTDDLATPITAAMDGPLGRLHERFFSPLLVLCVMLGVGLWSLASLARQQHANLIRGLFMTVMLGALASYIALHPAGAVALPMQVGATVKTTLAGGDIGDELFHSRIEVPWSILQFGGTQSCSDWKRLDEDGFPKPVAPGTKGARCHDTLERYGPLYLRHPAGSQAREQAFEILNAGEGELDGVAIDKGDARAVDVQTTQGANGRFVLGVVVLVVQTLVTVLLGGLALLSLGFQLILVVLVACAPVMLLCALFPGQHRRVIDWLTRIAFSFALSIVFAFGVVVVLIVMDAIAFISGGPVNGQALTCVLVLGLIWKRNWLIGHVEGTQIGQRREVRATARVVRHPVANVYRPPRFKR